MIMVVPFKFKSFGQGEKGYMGHTSYEMPVISTSSPWPFCLWDSPAWQVDIGTVDIDIMWKSRVYHYIYHWDAMKNKVSVQCIISSATKTIPEGIATAV